MRAPRSIIDPICDTSCLNGNKLFEDDVFHDLSCRHDIASTISSSQMLLSAISVMAIDVGVAFSTTYRMLCSPFMS